MNISSCSLQRNRDSNSNEQFWRLPCCRLHHSFTKSATINVSKIVAPKLFFGRTPTEEVTGDAVRLILDIQLVSLVVSLLPHKSTIFLDMVLENFGYGSYFSVGVKNRALKGLAESGLQARFIRAYWLKSTNKLVRLFS